MPRLDDARLAQLTERARAMLAARAKWLEGVQQAPYLGRQEALRGLNQAYTDTQVLLAWEVVHALIPDEIPDAAVVLEDQRATIMLEGVML